MTSRIVDCVSLQVKMALAFMVGKRRVMAGRRALNLLARSVTRVQAHNIILVIIPIDHCLQRGTQPSKQRFVDLGHISLKLVVLLAVEIILPLELWQYTLVAQICFASFRLIIESFISFFL
jgi:hypothetical protein